jgi:hypothetical protein
VLSVQVVGDVGYEQHDEKSGALYAQQFASGLAWTPE